MIVIQGASKIQCDSTRGLLNSDYYFAAVDLAIGVAVNENNPPFIPL